MAPASENLPPLLETLKAVDEIVKVDAYIPGCPTAPELIAQALVEVLNGKPFMLPERSVCDECPVKREKKASGGTLKRPLENITVKQGEPWENTRCYMEQGYLCLGPVTRAGCEARCIKGSVPCDGCSGAIGRDLPSAIANLFSVLKATPAIRDYAAIAFRYQKPKLK